MEFLLLFTDQSGAPAPEPAGMTEMGDYAKELVRRRILKRGGPLASDAAAACVRVRDEGVVVRDGPFAESKETIGGFWLVDVADRDAAIDVARRSPHARHASVEVHRVRFRSAFDDAEKGAPFLLVFRMEPGLRDPDRAKEREMLEFGDTLVQTATLFEIARLAETETPARIQVRDEKTFVTDGPFAESKEAIGGYGLVRVADRGDAIELAKRFPHARWAWVEVREILFLDRV